MFKRVAVVIFLCFLPVAGLVAASKPEVLTRTETYHWEVGDMPLIKLHASYGNVVIERGAPGQVTLVLEAQAEGYNARNWLDRLSVRADPFGAGLAIKTKGGGSGVEFTFTNTPERRLALRLQVPPQCTLDLTSDQGGINFVDQFEGDAKAFVKKGVITAWRIMGKLEATTYAGSVFIEYVSDELSVRCHQGDMELGVVKGYADLRADNGNITVVESQGGLHARAIKGSVVVGLRDDVPVDSKLTASIGDVVVALNPEAPVHLVAKSSWGKVRSGLEWKDSPEKTTARRLVGQRNGGGVLLDLQASGGNVMINTGGRRG